MPISTAFTVVVLILCLKISLGLRPCNRSGLGWAPRRRKAVFMTFMNNPHCPTWVTRSRSTKKRITGRNTVYLPQGVPFAFICGACFTPSFLQANLTAETNTGDPLAMTPLLGADKQYEHKIHPKDRSTVCLLSHGLTSAEHSRGTIDCVLNRGQKRTKEPIYVRVTTPTLITEEEGLTVGADGFVTLRCPETDLGSVANAVHVWHYSALPEGAPGGVQVPVPRLETEVRFRPSSNERRVVCSAYDFTDAGRVWQRSYRLAGAPEATKQQEDAKESGWTIDGEEVDAKAFVSPEEQKRKSYIVIGGVIAGGLFISLLLIAVSMGLLKCKRGHHTLH